MKICVLNHPSYELLSASLIEGLKTLGHEVGCLEDSSYGSKLPEEQFTAFAQDADLIVLCGRRDDIDFLRGVTNPRIVAIDGTDFFHVQVSTNLKLKAVFKRELSPLENAAANRIYPFPFASEQRYFIDNPEKDIQVSFLALMQSNPLRSAVHYRLLARKNPQIISGMTGERSYNVGQPNPQAIDTPVYRQLLARSKISINVPGWGFDCARYWEIPAAGAMLMTFKPEIDIPDPLINGEECVEFGSMVEFDEKLDYYLAHPEQVNHIAQRGREKILQKHTSTARASWFLRHALTLAQREGYCEQFYKPEA